jgi:hypothetical protein
MMNKVDFCGNDQQILVVSIDIGLDFYPEEQAVSK